MSDDHAQQEAADEKTKIAASIDAKGSNSYYYAHSRPKEDLTQAKRIEGDGTRRLADLDGGPAKLETLDEWWAAAQNDAERITWREDYAWGDDGAKVKIYVEFPEGSLKGPAVRVESKFQEKRFELKIRGLEGSSNSEGVRNGEHELSGVIIPEKCSHRISAGKNRITVTLVKADESESWSTLKKKVISKHTGWN
eukprot:CAMPEP_0117535890 /NCGR_PEP_ID=MMETSP0784-20121206/41166_1 /TAXON_ID=39447 /ORGANISM="" /LENGTH=194 /DNA_ID=CAMNT_0005332427 /DNA_START=131 /DNA_END=715 /DNA_ORIENTATION=+